MRKLISLLTALLLLSFVGKPVRKHPVRVLFIGNSYTYVNDLPLLTSKVASSVGDSIEVDSYCQPSYSLEQHCADTASVGKIRSGKWDYCVLQEQSKRPFYPDSVVEMNVYPFAKRLDSICHAANPKGKIVFYMTWGRKNGDTSMCTAWPPACSYWRMDSILAVRYMQMAKMSHASVSPVGAVWNYLRRLHPGIELYDKDESHPSKAGTYAAACCFYTVLFKKNPQMIQYDYDLGVDVAASIKNAVKLVVYDRLDDWNFN